MDRPDRPFLRGDPLADDHSSQTAFAVVASEVVLLFAVYELSAHHR